MTTKTIVEIDIPRWVFIAAQANKAALAITGETHMRLQMKTDRPFTQAHNEFLGSGGQGTAVRPGQESAQI
jgi:hypothetical protein